MKEVFSNDMVCHVWAQQSQQEGRNSTNSIFFEGDTIYSYGAHFPMARFVSKKNQKTKTAVLFCSKKYSVTTSKHQRIAHSAIDKQKYKIFEVPFVLSPEKNIPYFLNRLRSAINKTKRARASRIFYPPLYEWRPVSGFKKACHELKEIKIILKELKEFSDFFDLKWKFDFKSECQGVTEALKKKKNTARLAKKNAPKIAKRNRKNKARTLRKKIQKYINNEIQTWDFRDWELSQRLHKSPVIQAKREAVKKSLDKIQRQKEKIKLKSWLNGEISNYYSYDIPVFLRIHGEDIQTSRGAIVPIKFLKKAWLVIQECKKNKTSWRPNGHKIPLGHFSIDEINANGNIKAGCHTILYGPIKNIARQLNFI